MSLRPILRTPIRDARGCWVFGPGDPVWSVSFALCCISVILILIVFAIVQGYRVIPQWVPPGAFVSVGIVVMSLAWILGVASIARAPARLRACLTLPRCACCDYDLHGIPPEADGCTACPECGAAWRLPGDAEAGHYEVKQLGLRLRDDRGRSARHSTLRRALRVLALALGVTGLIAVVQLLAGPIAAGVLYMTAIAVAVVAVVRKELRRGDAADPVGEALVANRCPVCETLLRQPAEPDGCTVCPECSAAWRLPERSA